MDLKSAGKSDDLAKTVNYGEAVGIITDVFNSKERNLIESVAEDIARELLSKYTISKVLIRIRKPHAPISANFDTVEVELDRAN